MKETKLKVEYKSVDKLIPYVNNARTHDEKQVTQIAASIKEFGFNNPILLDGDNGVVAGHGRLMAAKKLGLKEVPCIELSHLTEVQKKAYILADNKLAENAGWDEKLLQVELESLGAAGFDISLAGFTEPTQAETEKLSQLKFESIYFEPKHKPKITLSDCLNLEKFNAKMGVVESSSLSPELKEVLKMFCYRFIKIDFENVANYYYFNASEEEKQIIERLRLVLCDSGLHGFIEDDILRAHESIEGWAEND